MHSFIQQYLEYIMQIFHTFMNSEHSKKYLHKLWSIHVFILIMKKQEYELMCVILETLFVGTKPIIICTCCMCVCVLCVCDLWCVCVSDLWCVCVCCVCVICVCVCVICDVCVCVLYVCVCVCVCVFMYIHIHVCVCFCVCDHLYMDELYIYICIHV